MGKRREENKAVLEAAKQMPEQSLVVGTAGCFSLRLPPEEEAELLAITPGGQPYDSLNTDDKGAFYDLQKQIN